MQTLLLTSQDRAKGGGYSTKIKLPELVEHTGLAVCISRNCLVLKIETGLNEDLLLLSQQTCMLTYISCQQQPLLFSVALSFWSTFKKQDFFVCSFF